MDPNEKRLAVSVASFAKMLDICENTARNWIKQGRVRTVIIGGTRLIPIEAIRELVKLPTEDAGFTYIRRGELAKKRSLERMAKRKAAAQQQFEAAD